MELPDPLFCLAALGVLLAKNGFVTYNVLFGGRFLAPEVESCATAAANQGLPSQSLSVNKKWNPYKIHAKFVSGQDGPTTMYETKETSILGQHDEL